LIISVRRDARESAPSSLLTAKNGLMKNRATFIPARFSIMVQPKFATSLPKRCNWKKNRLKIISWYLKSPEERFCFSGLSILMSMVGE
jgi:hypothetical protein